MCEQAADAHYDVRQFYEIPGASNMPLYRPKIAQIYGIVGAGEWYNNTGANAGTIRYVAHAITAAHAAIRLAAPTASGASNNAINHPDQRYWMQNIDVAAAQQAVRIEIDCTLLPCSAGLHACLVRVPARIAALGIPNKPLRIFSHRNELPVRDYSEKRYFDCNSSNNPAQLAAALTNSDWWQWSPWAGQYT